MQSTVLPALLDGLTDAERAALLARRPLRSLVEVFAGIPDPRSRHGLRYPLSFLLTCLVAALLCNCTSLDAVSQWCGEHQALLRRVFGPRRFLTPTGALFRWLLPRRSVAQVEWAISSWVLASRPEPDAEAVALDGKTLRRAGAAEQPKPHLLSIATHESRETLVQVRVADQTNEIPVAQALVPWVPLQDRVVTADALHGHPGLARVILAHGGHYLLGLKANEPHADAAVVQYFADPDAITTMAQTRDRQHGRIERRTRRVSTELNAYLTTFPALGQVAELTRSVQERTGTRITVDYFVTSCPQSRLTRPLSLGTSDGTGPSRADTGSGTRRLGRIAPGSAPARRRTSSPRCGIS
jgi:hypothetical protein